jgi:hypothetical protein
LERDTGERIVRDGCRTPVPSAGTVERPRCASHPQERTSPSSRLRLGQRPHSEQPRHGTVTAPPGRSPSGERQPSTGSPIPLPAGQPDRPHEPLRLWLCCKGQPARRHGLNRCGCSRKLGAAQVSCDWWPRNIPDRTPLRRPEAADQPARRWLSESQPSLALGITQAVCRDFFRCLTHHRQARLGQRRSERTQGAASRFAGRMWRKRLAGVRGRAARCRSRSSCRRSFPTTFSALGARGVPRPMVCPCHGLEWLELCLSSAPNS